MFIDINFNYYKKIFYQKYGDWGFGVGGLWEWMW